MAGDKDYSMDIAVVLFSSIAGIFVFGIFWGVNRIGEHINANTNNESRCRYIGTLNTVRLDDDGEYHFSTNSEAYSDVSDIWVHIERKDIDSPTLCKYESRRVLKSGDGAFSDWSGSDYKIELPLNYKIETFDD